MLSRILLTLLRQFFLEQITIGNFSDIPLNHPPELLPSFRAQSYFPELKEQPAVTDLFHRSSLRPLSATIFGQGGLKAVRGGLAHYLLVHGAGVNFGPFPRYAVFFRLSHRAHRAWPDPGFSDLWNDWRGLDTDASSTSGAG